MQIKKDPNLAPGCIFWLDEDNMQIIKGTYTNLQQPQYVSVLF